MLVFKNLRGLAGRLLLGLSASPPTKGYAVHAAPITLTDVRLASLAIVLDGGDRRVHARRGRA